MLVKDLRVLLRWMSLVMNNNDVLTQSELALQKTLAYLQETYSRSGRDDYLTAAKVILQSLSNTPDSTVLAEYNNKEVNNGSSYTPD